MVDYVKLVPENLAEMNDYEKVLNHLTEYSDIEHSLDELQDEFPEVELLPILEKLVKEGLVIHLKENNCYQLEGENF